MADFTEKSPYEKLENIVMNRVCQLEEENEQLKNDLALANAKLSVYERIATISDSKHVVGFGPPSIMDDR